MVLLGILSSTTALAQEASKATEKGESTGWEYWGIALLGATLVFAILAVVSKAASLEEEETTEAFSLSAWWKGLDSRFFTKAVSIEKEQDILLDHDYDGIKELDNSLPPWWKWGFYITIVVAVFYVFRYHVWNTGMNPEQEYHAEMKLAAEQIEAYRKKSGDMVDEKTVTLADAQGIAAGKQIYQKQCFVCHGANGEGGVGPNLTDEYWLHGGKINDVFKSIKYGIPEKGMQAWEKTFSPSEIKNLSSFVKSLQGTKPANGKAPQGDIYTEAAPAATGDSSIAKN